MKWIVFLTIARYEMFYSSDNIAICLHLQFIVINRQLVCFIHLYLHYCITTCYINSVVDINGHLFTGFFLLFTLLI